MQGKIGSRAWDSVVVISPLILHVYTCVCPTVKHFFVFGAAVRFGYIPGLLAAVFHEEQSLVTAVLSVFFVPVAGGRRVRNRHLAAPVATVPRWGSFMIEREELNLILLSERRHCERGEVTLRCYQIKRVML